jgi:hypothetical protein
MCKSNGESVSHLLLHCPIAHELWNLNFTLFGTVWVMPRGLYELFACWSGKVGKSDSGAIWKAVPHCLMWCLWHERNSRTFSGEEQSVPALKFTFLQTLFEWLKASNLISAHSVAEMLDNCSFYAFNSLFLLCIFPLYFFLFFINEILIYQKKKKKYCISNRLLQCIIGSKTNYNILFINFTNSILMV